MTTHDTPEAVKSLARAMTKVSRAGGKTIQWGSDEGSIAAAILAALDGWTLVPGGAWEAMQGDAADLTDVMDEAAALRTALRHVLVRTHDTGCGTCDAARALVAADHELPSFVAKELKP